MDADAPPKHLERLIIAAPGSAVGAAELEKVVADAALVADAVNGARDLQNRPGNDLTPSALARHARGPRAGDRRAVGRGRGPRADRRARDGGVLGGRAGLARGASADHDALRAAGRRAGGRSPLGLVGKAVTFDSGGISLKPGAKMAEMKFDMSGGAAVVQAVAAIARLGLPVKLVAVVGATENLPERTCRQARGHRHGGQREDDRGQQHRRRGSPGARRLPVPRGRAGSRADRRSGDADRGGASSRSARPMRG